MESAVVAFLNTLGTATFTEVGDKTQLLAFALGARFRKPVPLIVGIFIGNICNQSVAVLLGEDIRGFLTQTVAQEVVIVAFMLMAIWVLFPDRPDAKRAMFAATGTPLMAAAIGTFIAEIGDKTELMAAVFGARFDSFLPVVLGATTGSLFADIPAVLAGRWSGDRVDPEWLRYLAAAIFMVQAGLVLAT